MNNREWSDEQRAMAAADIFERSAKMLRSGDMAGGRLAGGTAFEILTSTDPAIQYEIALGFFDIFGEDRRAAVAAILAGKHPPDSLPGKVAEMRDAAARDVITRDASDWRASRRGAEVACGDVLALLGVKP